jgi:hypothetical protein
MENIQLKRSPGIINPLHSLQPVCVFPLLVGTSSDDLPLNLLFKDERLGDLDE